MVDPTCQVELHKNQVFTPAAAMDLSETHSRQTNTPADHSNVPVKSVAHEMSTAL
jgi:hypothetical protein